MRETSSRMIFVAVCAWISTSLLIVGWLPDLGEVLRYVWMMSGLLGLVAAVGLAEVIKKDIAFQEMVLDEYRTAALTDGLTGLSNRQAFETALERTRGQVGINRFRLSLLLMDIDHFKSVNDTFGHHTGDEVLRFIGQAANTFFSGKGAVARYGGEEFAVALPGYRLADAVATANEFREFLAVQRYSREGHDIFITMSIGACEAEPGESSEAMIDRTDRALYAAKRMGRNCVWFSQPNTESGLDLILDAVGVPVTS